MKRLMFSAAAALALTSAQAVPDDARRAECAKEAKAVLVRLTPDERGQMLMMGNPGIEGLGVPRFHW